MGKRVLDLKEKKEKTKLPVLTVAVISMFLLIAVIAVVTKDKDLGFLKPVKEETPVAEKPVEEVKEVEVEEPKVFEDRIVSFVDNLETYDYETLNKKYYMYMDCDGNYREAGKTMSVDIWAMLAYASHYTLTNQEEDISKIQDIEKRLYFTFGKYHPEIVLQYYPDFDYSNTESNYFMEYAIMGAQLNEIYDLLEGKNVLENEELFREIVAQIGFDFVEIPYSVEDVQTGSMITESILSSLEFNKDSTSLKKGELVNEAESVFLSTKSIYESLEEKNGICWLKSSEFNLLNAKNRDTNEVQSFLLDIDSTFLTETQVIAPVEFHPCMKLLVNLYTETEDVAYLEAFSKLNNLLGLTLKVKGEECSNKLAVDSLKVGNVEYDPNKMYLSDNAFQLYLYTLMRENEK